MSLPNMNLIQNQDFFSILYVFVVVNVFETCVNFKSWSRFRKVV